jgi:glycine C-acetyltransferase
VRVPESVLASIRLTGPNAARSATTAGTLLNFTAPNYLGLAHDPRVVAAARQALDRYGAGPGAGPAVSGRSVLHEELEQALCRRLGVAAAVLLPSGSAANHAVLETLARAGDTIVSDELNHASIVDGCRLSRATVRVVPHASVEAFRESVAAARLAGARRVLIVTDGVFSVDGDLADLGGLAGLRTDDDVVLVVDDAHGIGVVGGGLGTAAHAGVDPSSVVTTLSFSKALGGFGGAVAGPRWAVDEIRARARGYTFSAALPPATTAAALAALDLAFTTPLVERLWANQRRFVSLLAERGLAVPSTTPLVPLILGDHATARETALRLLDTGILAMPLGPPVTPPDAARIRFVITASHTDEDLRTAADAIRLAARPQGALA